MAADLAAYDSLAKAIKPDGTVDFSQDPSVLDMVRSEQASLGMTSVRATQPRYPAANLHITGSGKNVDVNAAATTDPDKTGKGAGRLRPLANEDAKNRIPKNPLWRSDELAHVEFYAYGPDVSDRNLELKAYRDAVDAIAAHFKKFFLELKLRLQKSITSSVVSTLGSSTVRASRSCRNPYKIRL